MARVLWNAGSAGHRIGSALSPQMVALLTLRVFFYVSRSFTKGIDTALLDRASEGLLQPLLLLDSRGGFFAQDDVEYGLRLCFQAEECMTLVEQQSLEMGCSSTTAFITVAAYVVRVMLNHLRIKRRYFKRSDAEHRQPSKAHPAGLIAAYNLFADKVKKKRKCPFINFRQESSSSADPDVDEDDEDDEADELEVKTVHKYFDGPLKKAVRLLSNGVQEAAAEHFAGEDGFIVARWSSPEEEFVTDVPSLCLESQGGPISNPAPLPPGATHAGAVADAVEQILPACDSKGHGKAKCKSKAKEKS